MNYAEEYISVSDEYRKKNLNQLYELGLNLIPNSIVKKSYGMPGFFYKDKPIFYFANAKNHLGFYPTNGPITKYKKQIENVGMKTTKGSIHLPIEGELPISLITKIIKFRLTEVQVKAE